MFSGGVAMRPMYYQESQTLQMRRLGCFRELFGKRNVLHCGFDSFYMDCRVFFEPRLAIPPGFQKLCDPPFSNVGWVPQKPHDLTLDHRSRPGCENASRKVRQHILTSFLFHFR